MKRIFAALLAICSAAAAGAQAPVHADMIVTADRIYTADRGSHVQAVAITNGRFVYAGGRRGVERYRGPSTRSLDFPGAFVYPGFADAHAHLSGIGSALERVRLADTRAYEEVIARVVAKAASLPAGEWVLGRGWDQTRWPVKDFPTHEALSRAVPNHPVSITRVDGHAL